MCWGRFIVDMKESMRIQRGHSQQTEPGHVRRGIRGEMKARSQESRRPSGPKRVARMAEVVCIGKSSCGEGRVLQL